MGEVEEVERRRGDGGVEEVEGGGRCGGMEEVGEVEERWRGEMERWRRYVMLCPWAWHFTLLASGEYPCRKSCSG